MELTMENLIEAANDITKVCGLQPPINTKFETKATGGGALTSAKNKFIKTLRMEIQVISECQDSESGEFDLQEGDVPLLKKETLEAIREISEKAAERLNLNDVLSGVVKEIISEEIEKTEGEVKSEEIEKPKKEKQKKEKAVREEKFTRHNALVAAFQEGAGTKNELAERANQIYLKNGGNTDNVSVAQTLLGFVLPSLVAFGVIVKEEKNYKLIERS